MQSLTLYAPLIPVAQSARFSNSEVQMTNSGSHEQSRALLQMEISVPKTKVMVACTSRDLRMQWQPCRAGCYLQIPGTSFPPVRLCCAPRNANQVQAWWFLGGCSTASFIASVWQYHQPAFAFVASYPGAYLTVWVSDLGYA